MRILFITHYDNMYGANKALFQLIKLLKTEYGEEPMLVIPGEGEMSRELKKIGVPCIISPITQWQAVYTSPMRFFVKKILRRKQIAAETEELYQRLKDCKIDVIHSNSSVIGHGAVLAKKLNCKHLWHIREFSKEHFGMKYFYSSKRVKEYYETADCLLTISDSLKENYQEKYPGAHILRIYDGVSMEVSEANRNKADEIVRFCYVGYFFPMKRQLSLLKACRKLKEQGIRNFELYLVGEGKEKYTKELQSYIEKHRLEEVKLPGYQKDVSSFLKKMDVGMIASKYEGFGLVTVEYMLHGLPVIGYRSGGTSEIVLDEITGILYEEEDKLVASMKWLIEDEDLRKKMGEAGKNRAVTNFTGNQNAKEIALLYQKFKKGERL